MNKIPLPREHGAWGMWIIPYCSTLLLLRSFSVISLLWFFVFFLGFIARYPFSQLFLKWKHLSKKERSNFICWGVIEVFLIFTLLVFSEDFRKLLDGKLESSIIPWLGIGFFLFLFQLVIEKNKVNRTLLAEIISFSGMSIAVPIAALSVQVSWSTVAWHWLWAVSYFLGPIFYVKMILAGIRFKKEGSITEKIKLGIYNLIYYTALGVFVLFCTWFFKIKLNIMVAFLPVIVRAYWGTYRLQPKVKLKQVGWKEVLYSIWFGIWIAI